MATKKIVLAISLAIAIGTFCRVFCVSRDHISAPFDVASESPQLCTIQAIREGKNIYDPAMYKDIPFILSMYTPGYHYLVASLPQHEYNRFFTGRIVSMVFMVLAGCCLFFPCNLRHNITFSILAIGSFFLIRSVVLFTPVLRNDSMALFFSAAAVALAERSNNISWRIILVSLLCFIAFGVKQSFLAATGSCFCYFLIKNKKDALIFGISSLFFFVLFGIFAQFYWGNGFWFSVFVAPRNPIFWEHFVERWAGMVQQPFFDFLFFVAILVSGYFIAFKKWKIIKESPYFVYLLFSTLVLLITLGKIGASHNYFLEPILAGLLWLVFFVKKIYSGKTSNFFLIVLVLIGMFAISEFVFSERYDYSFTTRENNEQALKYLEKVKKEIEGLHTENEKILNLASSLLTFGLQENSIINDFPLYLVLWNTGVLSVNPLIDKIINRHFDVIILPEEQTIRKFPKTPYDHLIRAILVFYKKRKVGEYCYFTPKAVP